MPPMNFFDGMVKSADEGLIFEEGALKNARVAGATAEADGNGKKETDEPVVLVGELTLPGQGFTLPVPQQLREKLASKVGQHVVLGIRPEHFHLRPVEGLDGKTAVKVKLNVVEPLGNDMDLYMSTNLNDHVVGRVEAQTGLVIGTEATLYVDTRKIHVFEPGEIGLNLSLGKSSGNGPVTGQKNETAHALA
jgi:ABC-type sugar transport system ATPase subunit